MSQATLALVRPLAVRAGGASRATPVPGQAPRRLGRDGGRARGRLSGARARVRVTEWRWRRSRPTRPPALLPLAAVVWMRACLDVGVSRAARLVLPSSRKVYLDRNSAGHLTSHAIIGASSGI